MGQKICDTKTIDEDDFLGRKKNGVYHVTCVGVAELLGTATYVFVACLGNLKGFTEEGPSMLQIGMVSGIGVMMAIHMFAHISGAHINPATSICAYIIGDISLILLPVYILGQLLGAATGYGLLKASIPYDLFPISNATQHGVGVTFPSVHLSMPQVMCCEIVITVILILANSASFDPGNSTQNDSVSLRFGFLVGMLITAAGPVSGGVFNPARSFGPALWNNDWRYHWVYWVTGIIGAIIASIFYKLMFMKRNLNSKYLCGNN